ncbi:MAG TPA: RDD family protein [Actinomycetes bacterium]|nr:RDD family protein [Actinomycetes bacterium]
MTYGGFEPYGGFADTDLGPAAAPWRPRWQASLWDLLAIAGWLGVLTVAGLLLRPLLTRLAEAPMPAVDALVLAATVLPVWTYLTVTEAGPAHASWGKRRVGLQVVCSHDGAGPGFARSAIRNAVKLAPWQLAHFAVVRLAAGDTSATVAVTDVLSLLIPVVSLVMAWRDGRRRSLHDRIAGTTVVTRAP